MFWDRVDDLLRNTPLGLLGVALPLLMGLAVLAGMAMRQASHRRTPAHEALPGEGLEGVMASAILGLMALLMGFTFSIVLNRFDDRRALVLEEANAIGTTYLRAQLLEEPHRGRIGGLLRAYTDNRIALATSVPGRNAALLAGNDQLITDLWAATAVAYPTIKDPGLSGRFLECMNGLIDLDTSRKIARTVHVPAEVFVVVFAFMMVAAAMLGYLSVGRRGKVTLALTIVLLSIAFLLILDVDRPISGGIREDQAAMEQLKASLAATPPAAYDHYLIEDAKAAR